MDRKEIIGRIHEKEVLNRLFHSKNPEFLAIYGRRRIGKTYLVTEYFKDKGLLFEFTGSKDTSEETLMARFAAEISEISGEGEQVCDEDVYLRHVEAPFAESEGFADQSDDASHRDATYFPHFFFPFFL